MQTYIIKAIEKEDEHIFAFPRKSYIIQKIYVGKRIYITGSSIDGKYYVVRIMPENIIERTGFLRKDAVILRL